MLNMMIFNYIINNSNKYLIIYTFYPLSNVYNADFAGSHVSH